MKTIKLLLATIFLVILGFQFFSWMLWCVWAIFIQLLFILSGNPIKINFFIYTMIIVFSCLGWIGVYRALYYQVNAAKTINIFLFSGVFSVLLYWLNIYCDNQKYPQIRNLAIGFEHIHLGGGFIFIIFIGSIFLWNIKKYCNRISKRNQITKETS